MPRFTVATLQGDVPVTVADDAPTGAAVYKAVAAALNLPPVRAARLRLAAGTHPVPDDDTPAGLADGCCLTAVFAAAEPVQPAPDTLRQRRRGAATTTAANDSDDDDDDVFRYRPPTNAVARVFCEAALRAGLPRGAVGVASHLPRGVCLTLLLWPAGAKLASVLGLGPIYILASIILAIYLNLGTRRAGEASAYTIFNDAFRPLLGQFTADAVDAHVRRGGM